MEQSDAGFTTEDNAIILNSDRHNLQTFEPHSPPNYNDIVKSPLTGPTLSIPPPQYEGIAVPPQTTEESQNSMLRYKRMHLIYGTISVVLGGIQVAIDPILPSIFQYPYSMYPGGLFMIISGLCSIYGSRKNNKYSLIASLIFNILALIVIFTNYIIGILASNQSGYFFTSCSQYNAICYPSVSFYTEGVKGFAIFNVVFGMILFVLMIWDSSLKCGDVCFKKQKQTITYISNALPIVPVGHI